MNKPYITKVHIILEVLSLIFSIASVAYGVAFALKATEPMPTNFNMAGDHRSHSLLRTGLPPQQNMNFASVKRFL